MRSSTHELQQRTAPLPARKARCLFPLFVGSVTSRTTPKKYQIVLLVVHYEYQVLCGVLSKDNSLCVSLPFK